MKLTQEALAQEFVKDLNTKAKEIKDTEYPYTFELKVFKPKGKYTYESNGKSVTTNTYRSLKLYAHDGVTNERIEVYVDHFVATNPSVFYKDQYKESLYRKFLLTSFISFVIGNMNNISKQKKKEQDTMI